MDKKKLEAIIMTYLRAGAAAIAALYLVDPNRPLKEYLAVGIAAAAGPILKAIDPRASDFGRGAK
jgi:hypothetical protein